MTIWISVFVCKKWNEYPQLVFSLHNTPSISKWNEDRPICKKKKIKLIFILFYNLILINIFYIEREACVYDDELSS